MIVRTAQLTDEQLAEAAAGVLDRLRRTRHGFEWESVALAVFRGAHPNGATSNVYLIGSGPNRGLWAVDLFAGKNLQMRIGSDPILVLRRCRKVLIDRFSSGLCELGVDHG